ncbi:MAG: HypC/HybG/HupF family hydrogenase formation chaperone [Candidatus Obscuribacterales bacterium]|nr:HypC/HybG/HupF family hydrogenase formation chaperone [Candidatus Obscuribacterales bacterium]
MCLTVMAKVINVQGQSADVSVDDIVAKVFVSINNVKPGDWVLLSGGTILSILEPDLAAETLELLKGIRGK